MNQSENVWQPIETAPKNKVILTKVDDKDGVRNVQMLRKVGNLWWMTDGTMYVYYRPTHWQPPPPSSQQTE